MKKVILISGGSDGLGKTIAEVLSGECSVIIMSPNKDKCERTALELSCDFEVCDVSNYGEVEESVAAIISRHERIDCLINCAGLWVQGPLVDNDADRIKRVLDVNTLGVINLTKAVAVPMKLQKSGRVVNIISQAGIYAKAERSVYTASKWAVTGFTKSIQEELAPFGIGVTGLYPGKLKTEMFKKMGIEKDMSDGLAPREVARTIEFILSLDSDTIFPEIGIKHILG